MGGVLFGIVLGIIILIIFTIPVHSYSQTNKPRSD